MSNADDRDHGRGQLNRSDHLGDELLSSLIDGDVPPEERRLADAHLAGCTDCAARLSALRSTVSLLRSLPAPVLSRSFQLPPSYARQPSAWRRFSGWLTSEMPAVRAAIVAIVLLIGGVAAFGVLRDDDGFSSSLSLKTQSEATVAMSDDNAEPTGVATVVIPTLQQTSAPTLVPTKGPDPSASRSIQGADASASSTPAPMATIPELEAPAPAVQVTVETPTPVATASPERSALFGINEEAPASSDASLTTATQSPPGAATVDSGESADSSTSDSAVARPTQIEATAADESSAGGALPEPSTSDGAANADDGGATSVSSRAQPTVTQEATEPSVDETEAPASSAAFAPTPSVTPSPTAARHPATVPATPIASPVASPVTSPVVSPSSGPSAADIPNDRNVASEMTPRRSDLALGLAMLVLLGSLIVAARATRGRTG